MADPLDTMLDDLIATASDRGSDWRTTNRALTHKQRTALEKLGYTEEAINAVGHISYDAFGAKYKPEQDKDEERRKVAKDRGIGSVLPRE